MMSIRNNLLLIIDYWQRVTQNLRPFQFTVEDDVPLESSSPSPCISAHTRYSHVGHWLITQSRSLPRGWTGALDGQRGYPVINTLNWLPSLPCFTCLLLLVLPGITFHVNCCYLVTKSCLTLWEPTDCGPPGSSVHGISQAGRLEWVVISFSRGSSQPRNQTRISCIVGAFFTTEPPGKPAPCRWFAPTCWSQLLLLEEPDIKVFLTKSPEVDSAGAGSLGKVVNSQTSILLFPPLPSGSVPSGVFRQGDKMATAASDSALTPEDLKPEVLGWGSELLHQEQQVKGSFLTCSSWNKEKLFPRRHLCVSHWSGLVTWPALAAKEAGKVTYWSFQSLGGRWVRPLATGTQSHNVPCIRCLSPL